MTYSEKLIILNSLNWAIIASSAIGAFGQFVENRHRDNHRKLHETSTELGRIVYGKAANIEQGEKEIVEALVNRAKGLNRVKLRLPICGLFMMLFGICFINFVGICLIWAENTAIMAWLTDSIVFKSFHKLPIFNSLNLLLSDPKNSFNLPLFLVSTSLVFLCAYLSMLLLRVAIRQSNMAKAQVQITDWLQIFNCRPQESIASTATPVT